MCNKLVDSGLSLSIIKLFVVELTVWDNRLDAKIDH